MPEKGWYSLTVRKGTTLRVRELARDRGLTVDELMNELRGHPRRVSGRRVRCVG